MTNGVISWWNSLCIYIYIYTYIYVCVCEHKIIKIFYVILVRIFISWTLPKTIMELLQAFVIYVWLWHCVGSYNIAIYRKT